MIKRIVSLLMALCMISSVGVIGAYAEEAAQTEAVITAPEGVGLLEALGFEVSDNYRDSVKREALAKAAATLALKDAPLSDNIYYTDVTSADWKSGIGAAVLNGYMVGERGQFRPQAIATVGEAMLVFMRVAGFSDVIKTSDDYLKYAQNYDLLDGVSNDINQELTYADLYTMMYNALFLPVVEVVSIGADSEYKINTDCNILSSVHEIYEEEGIVTANEQSSLSSADYKVGKGYVEIDNNLYSDKNAYGKKYLAYNVLFYYRDSDYGKDELIYAEPHKKLYEQSYDMTELKISCGSVKSEINGREKNIKITDYTVWLVNGCITSKQKAQDTISASDGKVVFIDNDADNVYDAVLVTAVEFMWVSNKVNYEMRLEGEKGSESLVLDGKNDEIITITKNGAEVDFSQIAVYDVLEIVKSADGMVIDITASSDRVLGTSGGAEPEESIVYIEGKEYRLPRKGLPGDYIQGKRGIFYISASGYLIAAESFEYEYGYLLRTLTEIEDDERFILKVLNSLGETEYLKVSEKCVYENSGELLTKENVSEKMLIKYSTNSKGEVRKLSTANTNTTGSYYDENGFTMDAEDDFYVRLVNPVMIGTKTTDRQYFINQATIIFKVPSEAGAADEDHRVISSSSLSGDQYLPVEVYDSDRYAFPKVVILRTSAVENPINTTSLFVLKKMYETVDESGDIVLKFEGMTSNKEVSYTVSERLRSNCYDDKGVALFGFGDVFQLKLDDTEKVTQFIKIVTGDEKLTDMVKIQGSTDFDPPVDYAPGKTINMYDDRCIMFGKARNVKSTELAMGIEINNPKYNLYRLVAMNKAVYTIIDFGERQIKAGTANDIGDGTLVLARSRRQDVGDIVIFKDAR